MLVSLLRTGVPYVVAWVAVQLARLGVEIDQAAVASWLTVAVGTVYYAGFRWLETHVSPRFGWLLGIARPPQYTRPDGDLDQALRGGA